ncbi:uncharacterized protein LOC144878188 [Branchiostoma floridae x Branchiostoma japonicum]
MSNKILPNTPNVEQRKDMAKYGCVNALGGILIFLALLSICFGLGELMVGVIVGSHELRPCSEPVDPVINISCARLVYPCFRPFMLGAGIWTGLLFVIGGSLAVSLSEGRREGQQIGATQTMSWLNTIIFGPALIGISVAGCRQSTIDWHGVEDLDLFDWPWDYRQRPRAGLYYAHLSGMEGALATVGILEFIMSISIVYNLWNQQGNNQTLKIDGQCVSLTGAWQVVVTILSICVGLGDFIFGLAGHNLPTCFRPHMLGAGIWTNIFFMTGGYLAMSIEARKTARRVGVLLTLSLLNTIIFAPALIVISLAACIQSTMDDRHRPFNLGYFTLAALEGTLVVAGIFEFILSLIISVTCCKVEPETNQVAPVHRPVRSTRTVPAAPSLVMSVTCCQDEVAPTHRPVRLPGTVPAAFRVTPYPSHHNTTRPKPTPNADEPSTPAPSAAPTPPPVAPTPPPVDLDVQYARRDLP